MKKIIGVLSVVLVFCITGIYADAGFDISGSYRYRFEAARGIDTAQTDGIRYAGDTELDSAHYSRFLITGAKDLGGGTSATITGQHARTFGSPAVDSASPDTSFSVLEMYVDHSVNDMLDLRIGRQRLDYGRLVSSSDWSNALRAFDGVRAAIDIEGHGVDVFFTKVDSSGTTDDTDTTLSGVYYANENEVVDFDVYYLRKGLNTAENAMNTIGVELNRSLLNDSLHLNGEYIIQNGDYSSTVGQDASAYAVGASYDIGDAYNTSVHASYENASGDNGTSATDDWTGFDSLYESSHDVPGMSDVIDEFTNINVISVGVSSELIEGITFGLDYSIYTEDEAADTSNGSDSTNDDLGSSIDISASTEFQGLDVLGGVSLFSAGDGLSSVSGDSTSTWAFLQVSKAF